MAGEPETALATSTVLVRSWRTAFLTLRDETLSHPTNALAIILPVLDELIFSQFHSFVAAASYLPPHEVTSDLMYLLNLAVSSYCINDETERALSLICHLIHNITLHVPLELSSSAWSQMLESFGKLVIFLLETAVRKRFFSENSSSIKSTMYCLEMTRRLISVDSRRCSISENIRLVEFLLHIVVCCHSEFNGSYHSSGEARRDGDSGKRFPQWTSLWKVQTTAFAMVGEAFARVGSSFPLGIWQSVVEVLRKVMDALATKTSLVEDGVFSRFYASILRCLHLVLINRKGSLSDHVAAFTATLKMFLVYGQSNSSLSYCPSNRDIGSSSHRLTLKETIVKDAGPYRPPHLRRRKNTSLQQAQTRSSQTSSDHDSSPVEFSSSDSDFSDSDGALKDFDNVRSCKARVAAITCIQDLCEADPKAFIAQWTMLLPTNDVLHPRKYEATLMTCLLYDPFLKARLASASTIAAMLEGPSSVALQVAEYRESTKCGSFMSLSSNLGQILMQLHTGILHLIQHERHTGVLTSSFKILMLLISSTPYSRMPGELLPAVISSLRLRIEEGFSFNNDQTSLLAIAISCLAAAVSISPSSLHVNEMFQAEIATGLKSGGGSGVLSTLFQHAEKVTYPTISLEALQALKALCHNYPNIMAACWKQISTVTYQFLRPDSFRVPSGKGVVGADVGSTMEKVVTAVVKVMDECLRAVSGFKGTEDLFGDKLMETPFMSECVRDKRISSAPSYGSEALKVSEDNLARSTEWREAIEKHINLSLCHSSGMVRAASITCFAGITYSVFFSLEKQQQQFILSSCINAATNDLVPSVRSAACRAIGVIVLFPDILKRSEVLHKFINAVEVNTRDQLVLVRITASWAMANICDSFRHYVSDSSLDLDANLEVVAFLLECALRLTRDGDKIKSNAVRALGNLSRVIPFTNPLKCGNSVAPCPGTSNIKTFSSKCCVNECCGTLFSSSDSLGDMHLLEKIVQAFLSCITTGNVKVQWNVCHALSNLFLNESLRMQQMDWASSVYSILLLLLRDSSNFKIRIQAAAALAVPSTVHDYGSSFSDVVQSIGHILENAMADQNSTSSFKYRVALEKQLTASMLHVLGLCSGSSHGPLKEFLVKKESFFESWLKDLCSSLETSIRIHQGDEVDSYRNQKRDLVSKAIISLIDVYESKNRSTSAQKLQKMLESLSVNDLG